MHDKKVTPNISCDVVCWAFLTIFTVFQEDLKASMESLVSKFPPEWKGLFSALSQDRNSDEAAELWLVECVQSRFGDAVNWEQLLTRLCESEPVCRGADLKL